MADESTDQERRGFLKWLTAGFLALWAPAAGIMTASFLKPPEHGPRVGERMIHAGTLSSLAIGESRFIRHGLEPIFVVRLADQQVMAVSAVCTHMQCILHWKRDNSTFLCPCHDGAFDKTGNVLSGPPKKPLRQYPAEIRSDEIVVFT